MRRISHRSPHTWLRWLATGAVLLIAAAAGLGNAPGPVLSLVRHETVGRHPPTLNPTRIHMGVTLPASRTWVALYYFRYGGTAPLLQVRARSVEQPIPHAITLSYGLPGISASGFDIVKAQGAESRGLVNGGRSGWYAVLAEDVTGHRSWVAYESGQKVSRGYFSCSKTPRLERQEMARKLAPPQVRSHFAGLFKAVPRHRLATAPAPTPPARKGRPVAPPPKTPKPAPPVRK